MVGISLFCLFVLAGHVKDIVTASVTWTSASLLPNGTTIHACAGESVSLPWDFQASAEDHLTNVEFYLTPQAGSSRSQLLATYVAGNFLRAPRPTPTLEYIPPAGINISSITAADFGVYEVQLVLDEHGSLVREKQMVNVTLPEPAATSGDDLQLVLLPGADYDTTSRDWTVSLTCGHFLSLGQPPVTVRWTTPSGTEVPSTSYENGQFILKLREPITSGEYSCHVSDLSTAGSRCSSGATHLSSRNATLHVDAAVVRMSLMEERLMRLEAGQLNNETACDCNLTQIHADIERLNKAESCHVTGLAQTLMHHRSYLIQLNETESELTSQVANLTSENQQLRELASNLTTANYQVELHLQRQQQNNSELRADFDQLRSEFAQFRLSSLTVVEQLARQVMLLQNISSAANTEPQVASTVRNITVFLGEKFQNYLYGRHENCLDWMRSDRQSGVRELHVKGEIIPAFCDQDTDQGGWTVIQRRQDGSVDFNRSWADYEAGFGNLTGEFWLGLSKIHALTSGQLYTLRIDFADVTGNGAYAKYDIFSITGPDDNYRLVLTGFYGNATNSMTGDNCNVACNAAQSNQPFTTYDRDNVINSRRSGHCAVDWKVGGWWYSSTCGYADLNNQYMPEIVDVCSVSNSTCRVGDRYMMWIDWKRGDFISFKHVEMKIRPRK